METYLPAKAVFPRLLGDYLLPVVLVLLATGSLINAQPLVRKGWDKTVSGEPTDQRYAQGYPREGYRLAGVSLYSLGDCSAGP